MGKEEERREDGPDTSEDMRKWKREGQTWETAFKKPAWKRIREFIRMNEAANNKVATAASRRRIDGKLNTSDRNAKFDRVPEVIITQDDLRPAARGKIWTWESGSCAEMEYPNYIGSGV